MDNGIRLQAQSLLWDSAVWIQRNGWSRGAMFRDFAGQPIGITTDPRTKVSIPELGRSKACAACMTGAIHINADSLEVANAAEEMLGRYLVDVDLVRGYSETPAERVPDYNDKIARNVRAAAAAMVSAALHDGEVS